MADLMHMACFFMISLVLGMGFGIEGCIGIACRPVIIPIVIPISLLFGVFFTYKVELPCAKLFRPAEKKAATAEGDKSAADGAVEMQSLAEADGAQGGSSTTSTA